MSKLLKEIGALLGFHKVNTNAYHPQTDSLVDRTMIDMLAKTADLNGKNWDESYHLCFLHIELLCKSLLVSYLFNCFMVDILSYQLKMLYPCPVDRTQIGLSYYKTKVSSNLTGAWKLAQNK